MNQPRHHRLFACLLVFSLFFDGIIAFCLQQRGFEYRNEINKNLRLMTKKGTNEMEILALEKEVVASTKADLDLKRVTQALEVNTSSSEGPEQLAMLAAPWKVSLAAAISVSAFVFAATNSYIVALPVLVGVFLLGNGDPLKEETGAFGALTRLVGRVTIKSVESSKPKLRAMARAAITSEEEISMLKQQIALLQEESAKLSLWKQRRIAVDSSSAKYSLKDLKQLASQNSLPVGGNKSELMMRLVEAEVLVL